MPPACGRKSLSRDRETAVVRRLPVDLEALGPVNVVVEQYGRRGSVLTANGQGKATLTITNGDFVIKPNTTYTVTTARTMSVPRSDAKGRLVLAVPLAGLTRLSVTSAVAMPHREDETVNKIVIARDDHIYACFPDVARTADGVSSASTGNAWGMVPSRSPVWRCGAAWTVG